MGTTTTLRVERPDGTASEVVRDGTGRITITRLGDDHHVVGRITIGLDPQGVVTVLESTADGSECQLSPTAVERKTNPYGTTVDEAIYDGLGTIATTFDDEGRYRSVSMRGDWGEQELDLRTDGARTMRWTTPGHHGIEARDASGRIDRYEVTFTDATHYRWDRIDDHGRATITGWDGVTTVVEPAPPPVDEETA